MSPNPPRSPRRPAYKGLLAEPLNQPDDEESKVDWDEFYCEREERMDLLFAFYKIGLKDLDRWERLAKALADDHVPCFEKARSGTRGAHRQQIWTRNLSRKLWSSVQKMIDTGEATSPLGACKRLVHKEPFRSLGPRGKAPEPSTLLRRYRAYNRKKAEIDALLNTPLGKI